MHDYDPSWDYPVMELDALVGIDALTCQRIKDVILLAQQKLAPAMGLDEGFETFFVEHLGFCSGQQSSVPVALYCNGTGSRPIVGFDLLAMQEVCTQEGLGLVHQFELSLAHELGHGYQERCGLDDEDENGFNEDDAEEFGIGWADYKTVEMWRLNPEIMRATNAPETEPEASESSQTPTS